MWWVQLLNSIVALLNGGAGGGGGAYESIATASGTGSSATITFSSIPSTYQHLQLRINGRSLSGSNFDDINLTLNGITSSTYASHRLYGNGSTVGAAGDVSQSSIYINQSIPSAGSVNTTGAVIIDIHDYQSTTKNKTVRVFSGSDLNGVGNIYLSSGLYAANTNAISSITLTLSSANWTTNSTLSLYGIKGA